MLAFEYDIQNTNTFNIIIATPDNINSSRCRSADVVVVVQYILVFCAADIEVLA